MDENYKEQKIKSMSTTYCDSLPPYRVGQSVTHTSMKYGIITELKQNTLSNGLKFNYMKIKFQGYSAEFNIPYLIGDKVLSPEYKGLGKEECEGIITNIDNKYIYVKYPTHEEKIKNNYSIKIN